MKRDDILIVDDERRYAGMLAKRLGLRGWHCEVCYDGRSALSLLRRKRFRLVLLDLRLPDIYGADVLQQIKAEAPDTEVIILTGHGTQKDRKRCMALGARAFMNKPIDIDRLTDIMDRIDEVSA